VVEGCEGKGWGKRRSERDGEGQGNVRGRGGERREGGEGKGFAGPMSNCFIAPAVTGKLFFFCKFCLELWGPYTRGCAGLCLPCPPHCYATEFIDMCVTEQGS